MIKPEFEPILNKIIESFQTNVVGSYLNDWEERVIYSTPYDVEAALDLSRLMLAVSLHSNRKDVKPLARKLYSWAADTDFGNINYYYQLQMKSDFIADSSLIPSVLRALIIMAGVLKYKGMADVEKHIKQNPNIVLHRVYLHLMKNQLNHGKFKDLWGVSSDGLKYELYYTERTIEALTEFLVHYEPTDFRSIPVTEIEGPTKTTIKEPEYKSPTSALEAELEVAPAYLPILDEFARKVSRKYEAAIFKDVIVIYVLHFLNDLLPFADKFQLLGCAPQDMFFLVKTYDYPEKDKIKKYFEAKGCSVFFPEDSSEKTFFNAVSSILEKCIEKSESEGKKILIVEDGGYFAPLFHTTKFKNSIANCYGAVEQTTKGHRRDSAITDHQFPIMSVASSKLKLYLEAQDVAETLQENIVSILRKYSDRPLNKHRALILGYGTIGEKLADALQKKGFAISIYDTDYSKRLRAEMMNKYKVLDNLDDLTGFNLIIGASGETSLKEGQDFWNMDHNVILASGSSERVEFNLETLAELSSKITREEIFTKYTLKKDDKIIRLMCDGEPINFAVSGGIANSIIDPIYSEMFLSAVQVRTNDGLMKGIQELPKEIEEEVLQVFKTYYRT